MEITPKPNFVGSPNTDGQSSAMKEKEVELFYIVDGTIDTEKT